MIEEKINKTISSLKQVTFGRVDEQWINAFKEGMRAALEAEELELKTKTCENCCFKGKGFVAKSNLCGNDFMFTAGNAFETRKFFKCSYWEDEPVELKET